MSLKMLLAGSEKHFPDGAMLLKSIIGLENLDGYLGSHYEL